MVDALAAGYHTDRVVDLLRVVARATDSIADAVLSTLMDRPARADAAALAAAAGDCLRTESVGSQFIRSAGVSV